MKIHNLFTLGFIAAMFCSCGDTDYNDRALLSEIVTIDSTTGNSADFSFQRYDDSPLIQLTASGVNISESMVGKRVLLRYYPAADGDAYTSGDIDVVSLARINSDTVVTVPIDSVKWDATPVYLNSVWRSGNYLNFHIRVVYSTSSRLLGLAVDSATVDNPVPQLYLIHNTLGAPDNYMTETYGSYDISSLWNKPGCTGLELHINDSNLEKDIYSFTKK